MNSTLSLTLQILPKMFDQLPAIEAILKAPAAKPGNPICILVVCPTRELAQQAATEAQVLLTFHKTFGAQVVYGGTSMPKEQLNLRKNPCQVSEKPHVLSQICHSEAQSAVSRICHCIF